MYLIYRNVFEIEKCIWDIEMYYRCRNVFETQKRLIWDKIRYLRCRRDLWDTEIDLRYIKRYEILKIYMRYLRFIWDT